MTIDKMTRKDFDAVPYRDDWRKPVMCESIVILPGRRGDMHDSGYRCMDFVAVDKAYEPICRLSNCSDVLNIDGIGGTGEPGRGFPEMVKARGWSIDCLEKSGLLHLFVHGLVKCDAALSAFQVYAVTP